MITAPTAKAIAMVDKAFFPFSSSPIGSFSVEFDSDELFNTVDCGGSSPGGGPTIGPSNSSSPPKSCKSRMDSSILARNKQISMPRKSKFPILSFLYLNNVIFF